jgi:2-dehydro-3-deoxyphosphogalactonate aldolase
MTPTTPHPLHTRIAAFPLVAILRGLPAADATAVGEALYAAGFRTLEVPLNRPGALDCIRSLVQALPSDAVVGAGTVLSVQDVDAVAAAGGQLMVCPHTDAALIAHARRCGLYCAPGVATPTEAFAALQAGAHALKLFPADMVGLGGLKALRSVLPASTPLWPVGGITPESMAAWHNAGANGFGIGSQLYSPGLDAASVAQRAQGYVQAWRSCAH